MIYADEQPAPEDLRGAAVALGNFDGVHRGHQSVIRDAARIAEDAQLGLAVAVFEPHPRQVLRPGDPPFRIQSPGQRVRALMALGVETVFEIKFNQALAALSAEDFARRVLVEWMGAACVVTGFDFTFGHQRAGDVTTLRRLGDEHGFSVVTVSAINAAGAAGEKVSSSLIRTAISEGRVEDAAALLGRPWAIEGVVLPGLQLGRTIGYPTANVGLGAYVRPKFGVYAVTATDAHGVRRAGVASCGVKPTVPGEHQPLLETYIFDFDGDLYGRRMEVELVRFIRPEQKFENFDVMKTQIDADAAQARALLGV